MKPSREPVGESAKLLILDQVEGIALQTDVEAIANAWRDRVTQPLGHIEDIVFRESCVPTIWVLVVVPHLNCFIQNHD